MGEASLLQFHMDSFAKKGIIGVTMNYRVGALGFYDFSHLDKSFDTNCGISDLILALKWVKENIAVFGGNPEDITIGGQSAGGTMVYALLSAPSAKGLFQKAIAMSGLPSNIASKQTNQLAADVFLKTIGVEKDEISRLKTMPAEEMVPGGIEIYTNLVSYYPGLLFPGPVIDDLVTKHPWEALADGNARDVICMFGTTKEDGSIFPTSNISVPRNWDEVRTMLKLNGQENLYDTVKNFYGKGSDDEAMVNLSTDRMFWARMTDTMLAQSKFNTVYGYRFDYATPENIAAGVGANHSSDVNGALNTMLYENCVTFVLSAYASGNYDDNTPEDVAKARGQVYHEMHQAFVQFIKNGNPNGNISSVWEAYEETKKAFYVFNTKCGMIYNPNQENYELWQTLRIFE